MRRCTHAGVRVVVVERRLRPCPVFDMTFKIYGCFFCEYVEARGGQCIMALLLEPSSSTAGRQLSTCQGVRKCGLTADQLAAKYCKLYERFYIYSCRGSDLKVMSTCYIVWRDTAHSSLVPSQSKPAQPDWTRFVIKRDCT